MALHSDLTGSELHEPKGVASATDGAIATAASGSVTWQLPSYAEMYITNGATTFTTSGTPDTFTHLVNIGWAANGSSSDVTINADDSNDDIDFGTAGVYLVNFWATIDASAADIGAQIYISYALDGTPSTRYTGFEISEKASSALGLHAVAASGIVTVTAGQDLALYVASDTASQDLVFKEAGLNVVRIK